MFNYQPSLKRLSLILVSFLALAACQPAQSTENAPEKDPSAAASYAGKKVFYVDSYHVGYEWSDGLASGLNQVFDGTGIDLQTFYMDTKRNPAPEFCEQAGKEAAAAIESFQPDVVITADDNAQKCLVVPFLKDTPVPVIFLGVNWDASSYDYSSDQITGMIEVEMIAQLMNHLKQYARGSRIAYVTIASETEDKRISAINERFFANSLNVFTATDLDELKQTFLQAQAEADIVLLGNNAGAINWDNTEAEYFFAQNTRIPTGSVYTWMTPYALMTLAEIPEEESIWGAQMALRILDGMPVSDIPNATNQKGKLILNLDIAAQMNVVFTPSILRNAETYPPETAGR